MMRTRRFAALSSFMILVGFATPVSADVTVGGGGATCGEDPACINRIHSDIPMAASADPGERILFIGRDAEDLQLGVNALAQRRQSPGQGLDVVHPLTGPVYINGAEIGDVIGVTIEAIYPGEVGWTAASDFGFAADIVGTESRFIVWRLNDEYAESKAIPGVRIPNRSFPGVIATLPGREQLQVILDREQALADAGGNVLVPGGNLASPARLCGTDGTEPERCLRTIPPREFGGNMDIRYIRPGVTVYLPCMVDGCGLAIGDFHYAQGDGEVSGTAIEMDADIAVRVEIVDEPAGLSRGPHYSGPASVLSIPSESFYAVTGFPFKEPGDIPREIVYLADAKVAELANLSNDINLAARNALASMIDYIVGTYGYDRTQAYMIASVAVDLRIGQLVDTPNVGVTALLPLDIFVDR